MMIKNEMPVDEAVERVVLSSCMQSQVCSDLCVEKLKETDFYFSSNKIIFRAIKKISEKNLMPDILTVTDYIRKEPLFYKLCDESKIAEIYESLSVSEYTLLSHIDILREKAALRSVIIASEKAKSSAIALKASKNVIAALDKELVQCANRGDETGFDTMQEALPKVFEHISKKASGEIKGVSTGIQEVDQLICGMQNGDMVVVGGRPSQGKTAFALKVALHAAKQGARIGIFSIEMSRDQLMQRLLCIEAKQNLHALMNGYMKKEGHDAIREAAGVLHNLKIFIDDTTGVTPDYIRVKTRALKHKYGIDLGVIDYIQLMEASSFKLDPRQAITEASKTIKNAAKLHKIPIMVLSQMARPAKTITKVKNHRPTMYDLKESGQIEQDADIIMLVHREESYNKEDGSLKGKAEIIIAKQRNGPTGIAECYFSGKSALFNNGEENEIY